MSSQRYSENRTFLEENRRGVNSYDPPVNSRVTLPVHFSTGSISGQTVPDRIRQRDTTVQWANDPISGIEKFRVTINIDGFNQNEVNMRVDGNKLVVYGEHVENQSQSTTKKIIEKTYDLPRDIDVYSPQVTFPTLTTMQIDFPSRHSNVIIDDGRLSSKLVSDYDVSHRVPPRFTQEKSTSEYTSTRRIGGDTYGQSSTVPRVCSSYDRLFDNSSASRYEKRESQSPSRRGFMDSTTESFNTSANPTYTYRVTTDSSQPRTTYTAAPRTDNGIVSEKNFSETHHEIHRERSSPTTGVQSSHEYEHRRSGSPSIARTLDEDRFRTNLQISDRSLTPPRTTHNVEVREFSRRVGTGGNNNDSSFTNNRPSIFADGFNSDAFYRSAFQPQIFTDDRGQNRIEMKLDVQNYEPSEIKVSVNGNDLIVRAEHSVDRPPSLSTRAYFYKQISLPPNTDLRSISSQYHPDGKLHITAKLSNEQTSIGHN